MAIHDIDKSSNRLSPSPNSHDVLQGLQEAHGTESINFVTAPSATKLTGTPSTRTALGIQPVAYGTTTISSSAVETVFTTIPHNLGYAPTATAFLTGATLSTNSVTISTNANIPLPTFGSYTTSGGAVNFSNWFDVDADSTNFYVVLYNGSGATVNQTVLYYLYQQLSQ